MTDQDFQKKILTRLDEIEKKLAMHSRTFSEAQQDFNKLEARLDEIEKRLPPLEDTP